MHSQIIPLSDSTSAVFSLLALLLFWVFLIPFWFFHYPEYVNRFFKNRKQIFIENILKCLLIHFQMSLCTDKPFLLIVKW